MYKLEDDIYMDRPSNVPTKNLIKKSFFDKIDNGFNSKSGNIMRIFLFFLNLIFLGACGYYIFNLDKKNCECVVYFDNYENSKILLFVLLIINIVSILLTLYTKKSTKYTKVIGRLLFLLGILNIIGNIIFSYYIFLFNFDEKFESCNCTEHNILREFLFLCSILNFILKGLLPIIVFIIYFF